MKRIDDKISEIKKSQNKYRILFIAFVILIMAFMVVVFQYESRIADQDLQISEQQIKLTDTYKELEKNKTNLEVAYQDLKSSLKPNEYWQHIKNENSVEAYIDYLTNEWGIEKPNVDDALANIKKDNIIGLDGWVYVGKMEDEEYKPIYAEVVWRKDAEGNIKNSKPQVNDIVQMKGNTNRRTYRNSNVRGGGNQEGWRRSTRGFVADVVENGPEIRIKVLYY